ncbi:DUF3108 domain-containing protein [Alphaproteobacteria bacterium]|nr:DUF3108 domain-containing protein [Alphaproteobacteria bacterium]
MRIFFIIFTLIYSNSLFSKSIKLNFEIDWKSIHLADVEWNIDINNNNYTIDFIIQSYGMTDKIFKYKSTTHIEGIIDNNQLRPLNYKSKTKSSRQDVYSNITFNAMGQIQEFDISKQLDNDQISQQEKIINEYQYFSDPISQLTQYFLFGVDTDRIIIDGLNIYSLKSQIHNDELFEENNPSVHTGIAKSLNIIFPFFQGLHKTDKKNNLEEIKMYYIEMDNFFIPIQYDIKSKKFGAKLYLKNYQINNP